MLKFINSAAIICISQIIVVSLHRISEIDIVNHFTGGSRRGNAGVRPWRNTPVKNT